MSEDHTDTKGHTDLSVLHCHPGPSGPMLPLGAMPESTILLQPGSVLISEVCVTRRPWSGLTSEAMLMPEHCAEKACPLPMAGEMTLLLPWGQI